MAGVVAIRPVWLLLPLAELVWLVLGGAASPVGAAFFAADRLRYCHFVWHLLVLAGTGCHSLAVCFDAA
jgi:hemolysin III